MPSCLKCGAELIGSGKFCATCGAPAESRPELRSGAATSLPGLQSSPPDPYAETAMRSSGAGSLYGPPPQPMQPQGYAPPAPQAAYAPLPQQAAYGPPPPQSSAYVSPYAALPLQQPLQPQQPPPQQPPAQYGNYAPPPAPGYPNYGAPQAAPYGAPPAFAFVPGARVLVQWADGNRYPAAIQQAAGGQCLVVFPNGRQQWVEMRYLSPGA